MPELNKKCLVARQSNNKEWIFQLPLINLLNELLLNIPFQWGMLTIKE